MPVRALLPMARASRRRRKRPVDEARRAVEISREPPLPAEPAERTVIRGFPHVADAAWGGTGSGAGRRHARWAAAVLLALVIIAPVVVWLQYDAAYTRSTNAAVRGHITEIGSQLDGLVELVEVDAGDRVQAGDVLVRLEDRQLRAEVQEADADLEGLTRTLEVERLAIEHERRRIAQQREAARANLTAAEAQTVAAEIRAEDAEHLHRVRESLLTDGGAISREEVRAAETAKRTAEALLRESRARYVAAQSAEEEVLLAGDALSIRERRVGVLEADVLRAEARLARAEADLASVEITAPDDGAILRRIVQPGASVLAGQPLISMWLGDDVWIEAWIDENDIGRVLPGSDAIVTLPSYPDREFAGIVGRIGLATDLEIPESEVPQPRFSRMRGAPAVGVRIRLRDPPADLVPGMSASVAIRKSTA